MSSALYQRVRSNPKYHELAVRRARLSWFLTAIVLGSYYTFMMIVAFRPGLLATPVAEGSFTTVGVVAGAAIIIGSWLLICLYVYRANTTFDAINQEILQDAQK